MKAKGISIGALLIAGVLTACWLANESRTTQRLNQPSHLKRVGLGFRHERNDIAQFTLTGEAAVQKQPSGKATK